MHGDPRFCMKHGHDWAIQDQDTFMTKICLRCGAIQFFFPEEVDYEPSLDVDRTEIDQ